MITEAMTCLTKWTNAADKLVTLAETTCMFRLGSLNPETVSAFVDRMAGPSHCCAEPGLIRSDA
jgi:hypothetical protein